MKLKRLEPTSSYCLYCYAPLGEGEIATRHCPACGRLNLRAYHSIYWTRERSLVKLEELLKVLVVIVMVCVTIFVVPEFISYKASGTGAGWLVVMPLVAFGMLLWQTASLVTHKPRYTHVRLIWTLVFLLVPVGPFLFSIGVSISTSGVGSGGVIGWGVLWFAAALPCMALGVVAWKSGEWFERLKQRRIARGAAAA